MMLAEAHSMALVGVVEIREAVQELNWVEFRVLLPGAGILNSCPNHCSSDPPTPGDTHQRSLAFALSPCAR